MTSGVPSPFTAFSHPMQGQSDDDPRCRCQGHAHNALAERHPAPNGYCLQCPCTVEPGEDG